MKAIDTLTTMVIIVIIIPIIATMVPTGSVHFMTVTGTSMEPTITANDIIIVMSIKTQPAVGDIVSYHHTFKENKRFIVTHRVVGVVKDGYRTKGDAYTEPDGYTVALEDVIGIMHFKIPYLGALVHFAGTKKGLLTLVIFPVMILIMQEIREIIGFMRRKMRAFNKMILFGVMLTPLIFTGNTFAGFTNTFAYFSDVEYSTGNTLTAAVWNTEADNLMVSDSKLTGNGEKLHGITLDVSGTQSVTIDKIQIWWDISQSDSIHIIKIKLDGKEFFSGSKSAREVIDVTDYLLEAGSSAKLEFYFDSDVSDLAPFTINIIMGDGSVKSFLTDPKYRSDFPETSLTTAENIQDAQEAPVTDTEESQETGRICDRAGIQSRFTGSFHDRYRRRESE